MKKQLRLIGIGLCVLVLLSGCASGVRVKKGDTLYGISQKNNVPVRALIEENNLKAPYTLYPGQYLSFPKTKTHKVRRGETLYSIAKRYDMSVNALARLNGLQAPYMLHVGQMLKISSRSGENDSFGGKQKTVARQKCVGKKCPKENGDIVKPPKQPNRFSGKAQVPKAQKNKKFSWPVSGKVVSDFGGGNDGINIAGKIGSPVKAADGGTVAYAGSELKGYGNLVLVRHKDGWITAYAHNNKLLVKKGDVVQKGQKIAEMGNTGNVSTPQLHFEVRYQAKVVNPHHYLP